MIKYLSNCKQQFSLSAIKENGSCNNRPSLIKNKKKQLWLLNSLKKVTTRSLNQCLKMF